MPVKLTRKQATSRLFIFEKFSVMMELFRKPVLVRQVDNQARIARIAIGRKKLFTGDAGGGFQHENDPRSAAVNRLHGIGLYQRRR